MTDDVGKLVANASYDEGADVLYFSMGDPSPAASGEEYGPFVIRRGADGSIVGITIIDASHLINSRKMPDEAEIERAGRAIAARAGETYDLTPIGKSYFDGLARAAFGIE